jgi:hypothetical protein
MSMHSYSGNGSMSAGYAASKASQSDQAILQNLDAFIPSNTFKGSKVGYYFSLGSKGLGYYRDRKQTQAADSGLSRKRKHEDTIASAADLGNNDNEGTGENKL